jgi:hypothetical protein
MLTYTIENFVGSTSRSRKTLYVEGRVDCWQWKKLKRIILDSLSNCDELVINLERTEECDDSFCKNLCEVRERARKVGQRLIIKGKGGCTTTLAKKPRNNARERMPGISDPR